uniref:60S ribosomal protein L38 n=1 Tax=Arundo donax TaxID=35708 RepID=A0A0A9AYC7_ARUDO
MKLFCGSSTITDGPPIDDVPLDSHVFRFYHFDACLLLLKFGMFCQLQHSLPDM